jgi:hypothetical protein
MAMQDGKRPIGISDLTTDADCCVIALQGSTEQFFRQIPPFVVLTAFLPICLHSRSGVKRAEPSNG